MKKFLLTCLTLAGLQAYAQVNYSFTASSGTYAPLSGGTASTLTSAGVTGAGPADEGYQNKIPIGFTFVYNGTSYDSISLHSNGVLGFGNFPNGFVNNNLGTGFAAARPLIAPLWDDLDVQSSANITYAIQGSAPNRVFVVQYSNVLWDWEATSPAVSFQVRLAEGSNIIQFVYNNEGGTPNSASASVGLTAAGGTFLSINGLSTNATASNTTETNTISTAPPSGLTYTFTPVAAPQFDVAVTNVYSYLTAGRGAIAPVRVRLANFGTDTARNFKVYLNVTGSNTFSDSATITTFAPGAAGTLTFSTFRPSNIGTNTISSSVVLAGDLVSNNNSATAAAQTVSDNELSYATSATPGSLNVGESAQIVARFNGGANNVSQVKIGLGTAGNFTVVLYNAVGANLTPGTLIDSVSNITGVQGLNTINIPSQPAVNGDFFVGIRQLAGAVRIGFEQENPIRTSTFYFRGVTSTVWSDLSPNNFRPQIGVVFATNLPVSFGTFQGTLKGNDALLNWNTLSEQNNKGFNVERSLDGKNFSTIGFVKGSNIANGASYSFTDANVKGGVVYYRIQQVDFDGKTSYSRIVTINKAKFVWDILPNPIQKEGAVRLNLDQKAQVSIQITGLDGKVVTSINKGELAEGTHTVPFYLTTPGTYVVRLLVNGEAFTKTVIKQ
ncbi:MAG: T9SS type A sorting domain-containing protein [Chitinophagaceae bacterium]